MFSLAENQNKLTEIQNSPTLPAYKEAAWDNILKSKEEELRQAQQSITALVNSNESKLVKLTELEQRFPDVEADLNSLRNELHQAVGKFEDQEKIISKSEAKNEDLHHELQFTKSQLIELNQIKESQSAALGNWEQRLAEAQRLLDANRLQFAENEKKQPGDGNPGSGVGEKISPGSK